jgi:hypothetical protein
MQYLHLVTVLSRDHTLSVSVSVQVVSDHGHMKMLLFDHGARPLMDWSLPCKTQSKTYSTVS